MGIVPRVRPGQAAPGRTVPAVPVDIEERNLLLRPLAGFNSAEDPVRRLDNRVPFLQSQLDGGPVGRTVSLILHDGADGCSRRPLNLFSLPDREIRPVQNESHHGLFRASTRHEHGQKKEEDRWHAKGSGHVMHRRANSQGALRWD